MIFDRMADIFAFPGMGAGRPNKPLKRSAENRERNDVHAEKTCLRMKGV